MFREFFRFFSRMLPGPKYTAIFVDGPNMLRKEFKLNLKEVNKIASEFGEIKIARVFLNQYASSKLLEAVANQGYENIICVGDVDVMMASDIVETLYRNKNINTFVFVTRDSDFLPALLRVKKEGKNTVVLLFDEEAAATLKNTADKVIVLKKHAARRKA